MTPFSFIAPGRLRFGRGTAAEAAGEIAARGTRVLLVRGRSVEWVDRLGEDLEGRGCTVETVFGAGEPTLEQLQDAVAQGAAASVEVVVAVGGGSVIDLGKAVAALIPARGPALDYLEVVGKGLPLDHAPLPFVALPSTAGTGAEATKNAVILVPEHSRKVSLRDDRMLPDLALVDPALADGCPWPVTLASGLDAVTQVIEPYLSTRATPMTDALCASVIPRGLRALVQLSRGEGPDARDDLALTSLFSGMALANAGLGAVHGLAGVIGGQCPAPHGAVCGRLLPAVLQANEEALRETGHVPERFAEVRAWIAGALGGEAVNAFATLAGWIDAQGLPGLAEMGVEPARHRAIAEASASSSSMKGNPIPLSAEALVRVMERS